MLQWLSGTPVQMVRSGRAVTSNPLAPRQQQSRPRFLPDEVVASLLEPAVLTSARDAMIVRWLTDTGIRVGGLCGLRFSDLHLVSEHPCGQRKAPHVHIIGRNDNPNHARAKAYRWGGVSSDGHVVDGVIRTVSEAMIIAFYSYLLDEYHPVQHLADHEMVLVHVKGRSAGTALSTNGVRKMLRSACRRAGLNSYMTPHAFRHYAAARLMVASDFNAELVAQEFGWASAQQVTGLYGRSANREAIKFFGASVGCDHRGIQRQPSRGDHHRRAAARRPAVIASIDRSSAGGPGKRLLGVDGPTVRQALCRSKSGVSRLACLGACLLPAGSSHLRVAVSRAGL